MLGHDGDDGLGERGEEHEGDVAVRLLRRLRALRKELGELVPLAHRDGGFGDFAHDVRHGSTHDAEGFLDDGVQEDVLHLLLVIARELGPVCEDAAL